MSLFQLGQTNRFSYTSSLMDFLRTVRITNWQSWLMACSIFLQRRGIPLNLMHLFKAKQPVFWCRSRRIDFGARPGLRSEQNGYTPARVYETAIGEDVQSLLYAVQAAMEGAVRHHFYCVNGSRSATGESG